MTGETPEVRSDKRRTAATAATVAATAAAAATAATAARGKVEVGGWGNGGS